MTYLLGYIFIGLLFDIVFMLAIDAHEKHMDKELHNRLKWLLCIVYMFIWPLEVAIAVKTYIKLNKQNSNITDAYDYSCNQLLEIDNEFRKSLEEDP